MPLLCESTPNYLSSLFNEIKMLCLFSATSLLTSSLAVPIPCPRGTYSDKIGLLNESECTLCPPGRFCPSTGQTNATFHCNAKFFCESGAEEAAGTLDKLRSFGRQKSGPCPEGYSCGVGTTSPEICPNGTYCKVGTSKPVPCEVGHFNTKEGQSVCTPCPASYHCSLAGVVDYAAGTFYSMAGCTSAKDFLCPAGFFCGDATLLPSP